MSFTPSKADPNVWMRLAGDHYEYIAVYADDLAISAKYPKRITNSLVTKNGYKLKGVGPISYHLGADFTSDDNGTLSYGSKKYNGKFIESYKVTYGQYPQERTSPSLKGDHPELDDSPKLDDF